MSAALIFNQVGSILDIMEFSQIISTIGFPIAAYVAMFWYMIKQTDAHKEEMNAIKEALNANTAALIELRAFLDKE